MPVCVGIHALKTYVCLCVWHVCAGAANAGIPLSIIVKEYGWATYFNTLVGACALALLLLSPMMNLKSFVQRRELYLERRKGQQ